MKQYRIYIFDFDGTICDSKESLYQVFRDCFAAVNIFDITNAECEEFMHHTLAQTAAMKGVKEEDFPLFLKVCLESIDRRETIEKSKAFPETIEVLEKLKKGGKTLAVASGNTTKHIKEVMEYLAWPDVFSAFMGSDIYKHGKPNPEPLLMCLDLLGEKPGDDIVYIGDSLQDAEAAKNAGISCLLVDRENLYHDFEGTRISSLKDIL